MYFAVYLVVCLCLSIHVCDNTAGSNKDAAGGGGGEHAVATLLMLTKGSARRFIKY